MDTIEIKKESYQIIDRINSYLLKVKKEEKEYLVYDFSNNPEAFFDFKFAVKRFKSAGISTPKVIEIDKKNYRALVEYLIGKTAFDTLREVDIDEKIIDQVFFMNYRARINVMRLDFNPKKFIIKDDKLYYTPFTFTNYIRDEDFTQKEIRLWFYTNEFRDLLIKEGLPIDKSRLKNEFERNKEIVLTVVKYFR